MEKERIISIAKAIGIVLVVIGHSDSPIGPVIGLFHMALFVFLSGYFYKDKYTKEPLKYIRRKIKSIYVPYILFYIVFIIIHNILFELGIYSEVELYSGKSIVKYNLRGVLIAFAKALAFLGQEPMLGAMWFMCLLFIVSIAFNLISCFCEKYFYNKEWIRCVIILLIFIMFSVLTKLGVNIPRINNSMTMIFIFYLGYIFKKLFGSYDKYHKKVENIIPNYILAITCFILLIVSTLYGGIEVNSNSYLSPDFFIFNSIIGINLILYLSYIIDKYSNRLSMMMNYIGEMTLWIMALHFISFKIVELFKILVYQIGVENISKFPVSDGTKGWWVLYTIVGVVMPILIRYLYKKINFIFRKVKKYESIDAKSSRCI